MNNELRAFGEALGGIANLSETDTAIALLWYLDRSGGGEEQSVRDLAKLMHELSLRGAVNIARLKKQLSERRDTVIRAKTDGSFKLKAASKVILASKYADFVKPPTIKVDDHILAAEDFGNKRGYLQGIVRQINGTYQCSFYDCCVVMIRRLCEMLLIDAFENAGHGPAIKQAGQYIQFGDMIGIARGGQYIHLQRGTPKILESIASKGGTGAHDRYYITKRSDVDDMKSEVRKVVAELMHKAGL